MKRIFLILLCSFCLSSVLWADVIKFQATSLAYKSQNDYGYWSNWSDWENCNILVVMNTDQDRINIYSSTPQEYDIYEYREEQKDNEGGSIYTNKCIDANGLRCEIRLRLQRDGSWQLYVDYSDLMFVYNIERK